MLQIKPGWWITNTGTVDFIRLEDDRWLSQDNTEYLSNGRLFKYSDNSYPTVDIKLSEQLPDPRYSVEYSDKSMKISITIPSYKRFSDNTRESWANEIVRVAIDQSMQEQEQ
jgi:hypothetical protein